MSSAELLVTIPLGGLLCAIALIDLREQRIPDWLNATLFAAGLLASSYLGRQSLSWTLASVALCALSLWLVRLGYQQSRGRPGLGLGDVKFAGASGAWIGLEGFPTMLLWASLAALVMVAISQFSRNPLTRHSRIPFGPFLALGLLVVMLPHAT